MRDDVAMHRRFSLAGRMHKMNPGGLLLQLFDENIADVKIRFYRARLLKHLNP